MSHLAKGTDPIMGLHPRLITSQGPPPDTTIGWGLVLQYMNTGRTQTFSP